MHRTIAPLTLETLANLPRFPAPRTPWGTERVIVPAMDALDTRGLGVSTMQAIDIAGEYAFRGRFGRFGRFSLPRMQARTHGRAGGRIRARGQASKVSNVSIEENMYIYINQLRSWTVENGGVQSVHGNKISAEMAGVEHLASDGRTRGLNCGAGRACGDVSSRKSGGKGWAGDGKTGLKTALVALGLIEQSEECQLNQGVNAARSIVGLTRAGLAKATGGHFRKAAPHLRWGGTPRNGPPARFVSRTSVLAAPSGVFGLGEKFKTVKNRGRGHGEAGRGAGASAGRTISATGARGSA